MISVVFCSVDSLRAESIERHYRSLLGVAANLPVLHASPGNFDESWERYARRFMEKHAARIPEARRRPFQPSVVGAATKEEVLEIMYAPRTQWAARGGTGWLANRKESGERTPYFVPACNEIILALCRSLGQSCGVFSADPPVSTMGASDIS